MSRTKIIAANLTETEQKSWKTDLHNSDRFKPETSEEIGIIQNR